MLCIYSQRAQLGLQELKRPQLKSSELSRIPDWCQKNLGKTFGKGESNFLEWYCPSGFSQVLCQFSPNVSVVSHVFPLHEFPNIIDSSRSRYVHKRSEINLTCELRLKQKVQKHKHSMLARSPSFFLNFPGFSRCLCSLALL